MDCPATPAAVALLAGRAVDAYRAMDLERLHVTTAEMRDAVACVEGPLTPRTARDVHLVEALVSYTEQDAARSDRALRSVRAVDPRYALPLDLAPAGNLLRAGFDAAEDVPGGAIPVRVERGVALLVDGTPADRVPTQRAVVLQAVDPDGHAAATVYAFHADPLPSWLTERRARRGLPWFAAAGATGLASGALWTAALLDRDEALGVQRALERGGDPGMTEPEYDALAARANTLGWTAQATSAATALLLVVAVTY